MQKTITKSVLGALAGASLMVVAGAASATTITECKGLISTLQTQTAAAEFVGRNAQKDQDGLVGKLMEASNKLDVAKLADAAQKVGNYRDKVNTLCASGKIAPNSDPSCAALLDGANGALACIANIGM